jgi:LacI family transcriptional regulator
VALGYSLANPRLHVVMNHQSRNMRHAVRRLNEMGYRRIGFAMPSENDERIDHNYLGGYLVAQCELPRSVPRLAPLLAAHFSHSSFRKWFRATRPDVIMVAAAWCARVAEWLKADGLQVPDHVGLAVASTPFGDKTISGINEDAPRIGAMAVDAVIGMIHRNERGLPRQAWSTLADGVWFPGKTVRAVR